MRFRGKSRRNLAVPVDFESLSAIVARNLALARALIADSSRRSGRAADAVRLVCVTKYAGEEAVRALLDAGAADLGESHVQQLVKRAAQFGASDARLGAPRSGAMPRWHMIGHLQRNKVNALLEAPVTVHSLDSRRLAEKIAERAASLGRAVDVLIEVNVAGESAKTGVALDDAAALVDFVVGRDSLRLRGLMAMAPYDEEPERARPHFARLRDLLEHLRKVGAVPFDCAELSMGMSGDYHVAIEEGATIVRIGSALFAGIPDGAT